MGFFVRVFPKGIPIWLPLSVIFLQTIVPLLINISRYQFPSVDGFLFSSNSPSSERYHPTSVTLLAEALKCVLALIFLTKSKISKVSEEKGGSSSSSRIKVILEIPKSFIGATWRLISLLLPAAAYFASNVTTMYSLSHLRSYIFIALMNSRIIFAALLSKAFFSRKIVKDQWRAIVIIFCAATLLCLENVQLNADYTLHEESIGIIIALGTAIVSSAGGTLMEKFLTQGSERSAVAYIRPVHTSSSPKSKDYLTRAQASVSVTLWEQQSVLAFFSCIFALLYAVMFHVDDLRDLEFFKGWNLSVVLLMFLQAVQGILVAMTIQRCGIIYRLILGSIGSCLSILLETILLSRPALMSEVLCAVMLLIGCNLYSTTTKNDGRGVVEVGEMLMASGSGQVHQDDAQHHDEDNGDEDHQAKPPKSSVSSSTNNNSQTLRYLTGLLLVALAYISASSTLSVMLASKAHVEDNLLETQLLIQTSKLDTPPEAIIPAPEIQIEVKEQTQEVSEAAAVKSSEHSHNTMVVESSGTTAVQEAAASLRDQHYSEFIDELLKSDTPILKAAGGKLQIDQEIGRCNVEEMKRKVSWDRNFKGRTNRDIGICMQILNDAQIMDEYIAFHWTQGASKFVVYDDGSQDDPWLILQKYAGLGIVEYHDMTGHPGHGNTNLHHDNLNECFTDLRKRHQKEKLRWLLFPDVDEFYMSSHVNETLSEALNARHKDAACLELARTYYGSSSNMRRPRDGLVIENYVWASQDRSDGFPKMIANIYPEGDFAVNATALYTVHNFVDQAQIPCRWKEEISDLRVNHYLRSLEDYETKVLTGWQPYSESGSPFDIWWKRDYQDLHKPIAADYACEVRALLALIEDMKQEGKIPEVQRPVPYNKQKH